jgi:molecular chaperone DnaK
VLEVGDGVDEVKATSGDTHLGGDDYDQRVADWLIEEFRKDQGIDLSKDRQALQRLREASEKAKIELSGRMETEINLPFITADASGPKHLVMNLTRAKFEQLTQDLTERLKGPFHQALRDAELKPNELDEVVLVGGSTRMPLVQDLVRKMTGKDPNKGVNPDEVVAIGAAIQAGVLGGEIKDVVLLDVTPLSLGVETLGGVMTTLIERNTTIPTKKSEIFSTAADNQTAVDIHVLQGERKMAGDNMTLGRFRLEGIPPAPRGVPQIEVTFDIDANGILNVSAKDTATGREQRITITASTNLTKDEIDTMVNEAETHAEEDARRRQKVEIKNQADSLAYQSERTLSDLGDKIESVQRGRIESLVSDLRDAIAQEDEERMQQLMGELQQEMYKVSQAAYGDGQPQGQPQGQPEGGATGSGSGGKDSGVVEGEYTVE